MKYSFYYEKKSKHLNFVENAQTIHLKTPGTLAEYISKEDKMSITSLKITGFINHKDFDDVLDDMCSTNGWFDDNDDYHPNYDESPKLRILDLGDCIYTDQGYWPEFGYEPLVTTLIMPKCVKEFYHWCEIPFQNLEKLVLPEGIKNINCIASDSLISEIHLPNSVEKIEFMAFYGCQKLKELTIPKNVKEINSEAFLYSNITKILFEPTEPPKIVDLYGRSHLEDIFKELQLFVPHESIIKYQNAPFWNEAQIIGI